MLPTSRGFLKAFIFNLLTLGFYNWYLVHSFATETNLACSDDGRRTNGLVAYILLCMVTCGIYGIIWDYNWISRCNAKLVRHHEEEGLQTSTYLISVFFGIFTLGILNVVVFAKKLYLQNKVNGLYNSLNNSSEAAIPQDVPAIPAV